MEPPLPPTLARERRFHSIGLRHAWYGVWLLLSTQPNARVHLLATIGAVGLAVWLGLSSLEWAVLVLSMAGVWVSEALNTAIEWTVDLASPEWNRIAGWAKDAAAGAVLLASFAAVIIGGLLFLPKLLAKFA